MSPSQSSLEAAAARLAETMRDVLNIVEANPRYPWEGGALKQQMREDLTAYELATADQQWPMGTSEGLSIKPGGFFSRRLRETGGDAA